MKLVDGISHVATVTDDLDRTIAFYRRIFDAEVIGDVMEEEGLRHALIRLGPNVALHPFELAWDTDFGGQEMFARGRTDHYGVTAPSMDALLEIKQRLEAEGPNTTDGQIRDFGSLYSLHFVDPDGVHLEVNAFKPNWEELALLDRKDWTIVDDATTAA